ncbi:MAG: hypothetical protein H6813_03670 [Phycisphaeraceae bacterium]|nr:hypothetical protein [Phycisphaeraceae bacterium]MCB9847046.1 hypothetical protein [Phycisphaeraceae bacterium]
MGYGYFLGVCIVLFVLACAVFGVVLWTLVNRKEIKRSLLTHPRDRKRSPDNDRDEQSGSRDDPHDDLRTDAPG